MYGSVFEKRNGVQRVRVGVGTILDISDKPSMDDQSGEGAARTVEHRRIGDDFPRESFDTHIEPWGQVTVTFCSSDNWVKHDVKVEIRGLGPLSRSGI